MNNHRIPSDSLTLETRLEDLIERKPEAVKFLLGRGVQCIRCGEPVWSTLGALLESSGITDKEGILRQLNALVRGQDVS